MGIAPPLPCFRIISLPVFPGTVLSNDVFVPGGFWWHTGMIYTSGFPLAFDIPPMTFGFVFVGILLIEVPARAKIDAELPQIDRLRSPKPGTLAP